MANIKDTYHPEFGVWVSGINGMPFIDDPVDGIRHLSPIATGSDATKTYYQRPGYPKFRVVWDSLVSSWRIQKVVEPKKEENQMDQSIFAKAKDILSLKFRLATAKARREISKSEEFTKAAAKVKELNELSRQLGDSINSLRSDGLKFDSGSCRCPELEPPRVSQAHPKLVELEERFKDATEALELLKLEAELEEKLAPTAAPAVADKVKAIVEAF